MLGAANSMYSLHFAIWPAKRSVLERAVCHLAACSDTNDGFLFHISDQCLMKLIHCSFFKDVTGLLLSCLILIFLNFND